MEVYVRLGPGDEESTDQMKCVESPKIDVAAIHDADGTGFGHQQIESMNVVQLAVGDTDEARE